MKRRLKSIARKWFYELLGRSLNAANSEQGYRDLKLELSRIVPDLRNQYTSFEIENPYVVEKTRCQHAFQVDMALQALSMAKNQIGSSLLRVVDIGDSSGTHLRYLSGVEDQRLSGLKIEGLSVNLDPVAIQRIQAKGQPAILCRAEELPGRGISADVLISFQMLEHLFDPIRFLHAIAESQIGRFFVITVPYVGASRIGLHTLRGNMDQNMTAEDTHIFELCPNDWSLLFRFAGWKVLCERIYTQYPRHGVFRVTAPLWRRLDFEGFYGVILERDFEISRRYKDWN